MNTSVILQKPLADFSRDKYVQQPEARRNIDTSDLRKTLIHVLAPGPADIQTLCDRLRLPESAIKKELDSSPEIAKLQSDKKTWQLRNDAYRELDARSWPYYTPEERELALKVAQQALAIRPSRMAPAPVSEPPAVVPKQPDTTTLPARVSTTTAATARTEPPLRPSAPSSMSSIATNKSGAKGRTGGERINKDPKGNPDSSYSSRLGPQSETQPGPSSGYRRQHPAPVVGDKPRESMIGRYEDDNETGKGEARHVRPNSRRATTTTAATAATTATATTAATTAAAATTTATAATATVASVTKPPSSAGFEEMYQQLEDRQRECDRLYSVFQKLRLVEATASGSQDESQIRTRLVELARDIGIAVSEGALIHSETHREDFKSQLVDVLRKQVEQYKKARQEATALYQAIQERFATEPCGEPDRS
ncbi:uncharacterized protein BJ171DRAFT_99846 [Polychytrium aggregatum]|uniref:uncharacterized protein n=1 Tax=Polychytrium aggregatum TaxID=110093 RepID=UPI0022FECEE4|nr:uncharacterized protein BJ171DRAFT_99846 [Polychytrium aggregatum]KAI9204686.1 hypothetical protein BJ171DRAFT_99846 [Polychytrium aggregatum]